MSERTLQDPSAPMKRALFQALAIGAVAVVIYMFCVQPSQSALVKAQSDLSGMQAQQSAMVRDLKGAEQVKSRLDAIESERKVYIAGLLEPMLGSYAMRAKSLLDPLALGAGLDDVTYSDEPFRALPLPNPMPRQLHTRVAVKLTATGSYQQAVSFLLRLEKEMPLVSVQKLDITARSIPESQSVTMVLEWPAKGGLTRK